MSRLDSGHCFVMFGFSLIEASVLGSQVFGQASMEGCATHFKRVKILYPKLDSFYSLLVEACQIFQTCSLRLHDERGYWKILTQPDKVNIVNNSCISYMKQSCIGLLIIKS